MSFPYSCNDFLCAFIFWDAWNVFMANSNKTIQKKLREIITTLRPNEPVTTAFAYMQNWHSCISKYLKRIFC